MKPLLISNRRGKYFKLRKLLTARKKYVSLLIQCKHLDRGDYNLDQSVVINFYTRPSLNFDYIYVYIYNDNSLVKPYSM